MSRPLHPLKDRQREAADPAIHAWVSASAGTGKTQVLTARVLRLLLAGVAPERILCLTFTKAAASEMQTRLFERLAHWAGADEPGLAHDLAAIGAPVDGGALARARALFARALEAPGGLRVETLHAFASGLLAGFPLEAGVAPGFAVLDERTERELRTGALLELASEGGAGFRADLGELAVRRGEGQGLERALVVLLRHGRAIVELGDPAEFEARLRTFMGLPREGTADDVLAVRVAAPVFDEGPLRRFEAIVRELGGAKAGERADALAHWLACDAAGRCLALDRVAKLFITGEGTLNSRLVIKAMRAAHPDCDELAGAIFGALGELIEVRNGLEVARVGATYLRVGAALAAAVARAKGAEGALGFDDIIERAARLLGEPGAPEWVRYKLDQRIDHILVDEAQDTNDAQWAIVRALAAEFFAGESARDGPRTLFAVGDFKQSIFGFQGADPTVFESARGGWVAQGAAIAQVPLADNFRSTPAVLAVVDRLITHVGAGALGLAEPVPAHAAARGDLPGRVVLWPPVREEDEDGGEEEEGERGWISSADRRFAARLAAEVGEWLREPMMLPARGRAVRPEDILILVRSRREFIPVLVAALNDARVPVAGADRMRLTGPIAVQDLLALIRFVLQPGDDLMLATLLVSPLLGWSQDELFALAHGREGPLWRRLRERGDARAVEAARWLGEALRIADLGTPQAFLEEVLSGPLEGRARLLRRLGEEARDPVEELVNAAHAFGALHPPQLQGFLAWVEAGEVELKRDPDAPLDAVRIMTVHGAKGLQAPVVVLADATRTGAEDRSDHVLVALEEGMAPVPVFHGGKRGKLGPIGEACGAAARREEQESLRLLYVALTRAEDMLFVGGSLGKNRKEAGEASWHAHVAQALEALGAARAVEERWGEEPVRVFSPPAGAVRVEEARRGDGARPLVPDWAREAPPPEGRPARPLSPSRIGEDAVPGPPPGGSDAARRGALLHALFERLPPVPPDGRRAAGASWLDAQAADLDAGARAALLADALGVIEDARFAALFAPHALAEAPLAAVVGGMVVAGTVDRLLVEESRVLVVDFKTGTRVPAGPEAVPEFHVRQMAAYWAALGAVFPGREVEAALLYTAGPKLVMLPEAVLHAHAPAG